MEKALDRKLAKLKADIHCGEFIIADAKDPDVAFGIAAPGKSPEHYAQEGKFRSLPEFREQIRQVVKQGLVDIMLMSPHTNSILTIQERLFDSSPVTPAGRANDTSDIWVMRGGVYHTSPAIPNRSATIDHIQCGHIDCAPEERATGANLGLYSITFNNDPVRDQQTVQVYKDFRIEAERKGFRHFLEVFDPNAATNPVCDEILGGYVNDFIVRTLSGVAEAARPLFLKMVYHGPKFTEELAAYDPQLVIGILGGSAGTTYDAFKLIAEAQKYGARVALFGRKINNAEHQLAFVEMLRRIVDGQISPEEAVKAYHAVLQALGIQPKLSLEEDMQLQTAVMSYGGSGTTISAAPLHASTSTGTSRVPAGASSAWKPKPAPATPAASAPSIPRNGNGTPDFANMTKEQRLAYHRARLNGA